MQVMYCQPVSPDVMVDPFQYLPLLFVGSAACVKPAGARRHYHLFAEIRA